MLLVVAATSFEAELVDDERIAVAVCGIGPVEAALATAAAIVERRPAAILQIGIAGAATLPPPAIALGSESVYCDALDAGSSMRRVERLEPDGVLLERARTVLPEAHVVPIGTTARVGGGVGCEVEAMEGFGVLRAAALAGVPALELRAISNAVDERDRSRWRVEEALEALRDATRRLLDELLDA